MKIAALILGAVASIAVGCSNTGRSAATYTSSPETLGVDALPAARTSDSEQTTRGQPPSENAPRRFTYFDGTAGSLQDFLGRPLVVNFWASWCSPCIVEMPGFEVVYQELKEQVAFLGLNVDDDRKGALALIERTGVTYPVAQDNGSAIMSALGGASMPTTVLIAPDGETAAVRSGRLRVKDLRNLIEEHLGVKTRRVSDPGTESVKMETSTAPMKIAP